MADTVTLSAGTADGAVINTDDVGGVHTQIVKLSVGALDTVTLVTGGTGVVGAGTLRVTLATDVALPTGTNSIGQVTANAGTNLNTSALALEAGGNLATIAALSKAEDAAHSSGNTGVMLLAVREATVTDLSAGNTDGDYEPLQVSAAGRLWVSATVDAALPAGTNAIGKLAANSGVDIGDVDVTSVAGNVTVVQATGSNLHVVTDSGTITTVSTVTAIGTSVTPGTSAAHLGKAEDAAHSSGDTGVMLLAVREATATDLSAGNTDGDYEPLQVDANGRLHVNAGTVTVASHAVTNAGTFAVQETGTWVQVDDAAFTPATSKIAMAGAEFDDSSPDSVDEGDGGALRMSARRELYVQLRDAAGNERGLNIDASNRLAATITAASGAFASGSIASGAVASGAIASGAVASGAVASGAFASGALASGSIAAGAIADLIVDDAAFTPASSRVFMAGFEADESSTDSVDEGDGGAARMTLDRKIITTLQPHTAGGLTTAMFSGSDGSSILVATSQVVKASAGQLYGYYAYNPEAAVTFVHFYNTAAASVTVGTTNPLFTIAVPAGSAANLTIPQGVLFSNAGWSVAATTTAGGNTAPATGVSLVVWYA